MYFREYALFVEFKRAIENEARAPRGLKPIGASQGKGIFIFRKLADINKWKTEYGGTLRKTGQEKRASSSTSCKNI